MFIDLSCFLYFEQGRHSCPEASCMCNKCDKILTTICSFFIFFGEWVPFSWMIIFTFILMIPFISPSPNVANNCSAIPWSSIFILLDDILQGRIFFLNNFVQAKNNVSVLDTKFNWNKFEYCLCIDHRHPTTYHLSKWNLSISCHFRRLSSF